MPNFIARIINHYRPDKRDKLREEQAKPELSASAFFPSIVAPKKGEPVLKKDYRCGPELSNSVCNPSNIDPSVIARVQKKREASGAKKGLIPIIPDDELQREDPRRYKLDEQGEIDYSDRRVRRGFQIRKYFD